MKINRTYRLIALIAAVVVYSNFVTFTQKDGGYTTSYPAVVCPANGDGVTSAISLASSKTLIRKGGTSSLTYKSAGSARPQGASQALIVDAPSITPISWQARSGVWAGAVTCLAPASSQWFIGGTADVTSKGTLTLVNSGLGKALVGVTVFTEKGAVREQFFNVKANSLSTISLSNLAPGSKSLAIHVLPQTGRVNAFVIDERGKGLKALGGDTVNSTPRALNKIVIPAIPHLVTKKKTALGHTLRILVPGEVSAHINATLTSVDGSFAPSGIDGVTIAAGRVVEIPLNIIAPTSKFALTITSDRPLVAAVKSTTQDGGKSDFIWSTEAPSIEAGTYSITGLAPLLVLTGEKIELSLEITSAKGKKRTIELRGESISTYKFADTVRTVTFKKSNSSVYGALLFSTKSGYGFAPLTMGSALTRTSVPRSNIRVLIP
jgi:hypothetical protein